MQMIKLAAGRMIKIRAEINYQDGSMHVAVVGNPQGDGCGSGDGSSFNEQLLRDLMEAEVPEFGDMEILDSGLTAEGQAVKEKSRQRTKPVGYNPLKSPKTPTTPSSPMPQQPIPEGQLDTGFGL